MENVPNWMMICCLPWFLLIAAAPITDADRAIFPDSKYVLKGSNVSFNCKYTMGSIREVYWNFSTVVSPGPVYEIFNDTVSMVTLPYLSADTVKVSCWIHTLTLMPHQQQLDEIDISSGYPPETPKNISCFYFHNQNMTCSWTLGKDPKIPTTYHLTVTNDTTKKCSTNSTNRCSFPVRREPFGREYNMRMEVKNGLGNATREFPVNTVKIVKLDPPEILSFLTKDPSFSVSWSRPTLAPDELDVKCRIRHKQLLDNQWDYTPDLFMEKETKMSYNLSGLCSYTEYVVSLRCIGSSGQLWWSEWSGERTGRTAEQAPTHSVELWRAISTFKRTRLVYLRWKERSGIRSLGVTLGYNIQWFPEGRTFDSRNENTTNNEIKLYLSEDAHIISVVHYNSAGQSPKATLRIPATGEKTREVISSFQVSAAAVGNITVNWNVTDLHYQRFVLDWCVDLGVGLCDISFQYVENSSKWAIEKGILEPYKRYRISVYPILEDRVAAPGTTHFYIKEGAPLYGPNAKVEKRGKTEVTIRWDPPRLNETNGFITAFSIVYMPLNGYESVVTLNSDIYEYSLPSLIPNTLYSAYVVASTSAGNTSGNHINFQTLADSNEYIGVLLGILGTCLLLSLVLGIAYKYKKEK